MMTYLPEAKILFSCDLFGSHLATTELFAGGDPFVCEAAKRYYAEIMMPFRGKVKEHLAKLQGLDIAFIAPSHGPVYDRPECILAAHQEWVAERVANLVVLPYISMHGSTAAMACHLVGALAARGVKVQLFDLAVTDLGKLAIALVDAATIVIGTPTVHVGPHPAVVAAAHLANALRPKLRHAAVIGSYGWATKAGEQIAALTPNLKAEFLGAVLCKGCPRPEDFAALDALADQIQAKHTALEAGSAGATGAAARRP
jgi:flavorubredoxin